MNPKPYAPAHDVSADFDPLDEPAEEFLARYRRGERPALAEYEERFPALVDRIRALFPALIEMERVGNLTEDGAPIPCGELGPTRIGEFRILRKVGEGGMGIVYEAVQESLGRHVALKVLTPNRKGTYIDRFRREARAAAKLHHTNIVPVFGVGEADGLHFYAMQFIPGQGLDSVLDEVRRLRAARSSAAGRQSERDRSTIARSVAEGLVSGSFAPSAEPPADGPVPTSPGSRGSRTELATQHEARYYREVARIGVQVVEAIAYAHGQGVLHRDIKPSNLLLDLHGTVWVTDFGLAKADDEQDLTRTGDIVGTLRYMAPERFQGHADARSEVYALGVTLYELLTLRPLFDETDRVALVRQIGHATPPRPRKIDPHLPRDLETIVLKATSRDPADRYQTAAALADDLRRFLSDRTITARRTSVPEQFRRWARRNPAIAGLVAALVVGSVSAAVVFAVQSVRLRTALEASESSGKAAADSRRDAQLKRLDSMIAEARSKILGRKPGQRFESLALLDEASVLAGELGVLEKKTPELRNAVAAALAVPDLHLGHTWDGFPKGSIWFDISGDHSVYARAHEDGTCVVARVADNTEVCRVTGPPAVGDAMCWPLLSRDGRTLLLGRGHGETQIWRVGPSPERIEVVKDVYSANLRPDGRRAVFTHNDGALTVYHLDGAPTVVRFPPAGQSKEWGCVPHPTEPRVALWADVEGVLVRDTRTGAVEARFPGHAPTHVAWHPSGTTLAVATSEFAIRLYEAHGGTYRERAVWPVASALTPIAFNPSGDRLAGASWDATTHIIDTQTGRTVHVGPPFRDGTVLRWSPDGRRLAGPVFGDRVGVWDVGDGREFRVLHKPTAAARTLYSRTVVHQDGRLVAAPVGTDIALWDLETGRHMADLPLGSMPWAPVFDHTGALWTPSMDRTLRWRVAESTDRPGRYTIGPPERMPINSGGLARSADGQLWVGVDRFRPDAFVWRPDRPYDRASLPAGSDKGHVEVSPDGRWAVIAHHTSHIADLWDVRERRRVQPLYNRSGNAVAAFSPDGKWLWVNSDGGRLLHVGTWEPGPVTGRGEGRPAFTNDGTVMALETGAGSVRLLETGTGKELARLDNPHQDPLSGLVFTPDGGRLVGCSNRNAPGVHVWELRLIRRELAARRLDWDAPPIPDSPVRSGPVQVKVPILAPATSPTKGEPPLVTVSRMTEHLWHDPELVAPHHYRAHAWERLGMPTRAEADFDEAVRLRPNDPDARQCRATFLFARKRYREAAADLDRILADAPSWSPSAELLVKMAIWHLAIAPPDRVDAKGHDLARRAAEADPNSDDRLYRVAVGIGLLRTGRPDVAIDVLGEARGAAGGRYDGLVYPALALAHLARGDRMQAEEAIRRSRLSDQQLPAYLRLACARLHVEAAAGYLVDSLLLRSFALADTARW